MDKEKKMKRCIEIHVPKLIKKWNGIMFAGEAPGREEEKQGLPFVGPSGQVLDEWLKGARIKRDYSIITNVFHLRPEGNKIEEFFVSPNIAIAQKIDFDIEIPAFSGLRVYPPYDRELQRLRKEVKKYKPRVIITLGRVALWATTGNENNAGRIYDFQNSIYPEKIPVMPLPHPQYFIRQGKSMIMYLQILEALKKCRAYVER